MEYENQGGLNDRGNSCWKAEKDEIRQKAWWRAWQIVNTTDPLPTDYYRQSGLLSDSQNASTKTLVWLDYCTDPLTTKHSTHTHVRQRLGVLYDRNVWDGTRRLTITVYQSPRDSHCKFTVGNDSTITAGLCVVTTTDISQSMKMQYTATNTWQQDWWSIDVKSKGQHNTVSVRARESSKFTSNEISRFHQ